MRFLWEKGSFRIALNIRWKPSGHPDPRGRVTSAPEQGPHLYYGGDSYYLMEIDGEWVVVARSSWIT
jgi:hypothetical protein